MGSSSEPLSFVLLPPASALELAAALVSSAPGLTSEQPSPLSRPVRIQAVRSLGPPPISGRRGPSPGPGPGGGPAAAGGSPQGGQAHLALPVLPTSRLPKAAQAHHGGHGKKRRRSNGPSPAAHGENGAPSSSAQGARVYLPLKKRRRCRSRSPNRSGPNGGGRREGRSCSRSPSPKRSTAGSSGSSGRGRSPVPHPARAAAAAAAAASPRSAPAAAPPPVAPGSGSGAPLEVRTVSPTLRGIAESARILLSRGRGSCSAGSRGIGVLSFPTETVYTLACCVGVRNFVRKSGEGGRSGSESSAGSGSGMEGGGAEGGLALRRLLRIKGRLPSRTASLADPDAPLVYLHDPSHSRRFVQFTKPKTFVLKPSAAASSAPATPRGGDETPDRTPGGRVLRPAVTFSESREVLDRLAAAFWPGPVAIFAPVKMRRSGGAARDGAPSAGAAARDEAPSVGGTSGKSARTGSSSAGEESVEEGGAAAGGAPKTPAGKGASPGDEQARATPILPSGALVSLPASRRPRDSEARQERADDRQQRPRDGGGGGPLVGMRCPSHPLSRKILAEVYARDAAARGPIGGGGPGGGGNGPRRRSAAVVGHFASVPVPGGAGRHGGAGSAAPPTKARDVCAALLSCAAPPNGGVAPGEEAEGAATTTVHVLNGEDRREIFSVPTCQYGSGPPGPALLIDDARRVVEILRRRELLPSSNGGKRRAAPPPEVRPEDVVRALLKPAGIPSASESAAAGSPPGKGGVGVCREGQRVMTAVLGRWRVEERVLG